MGGGVWLRGIVRPGEMKGTKELVTQQLLPHLPNISNVSTELLLGLVEKTIHVANTSDDTSVISGCAPLLPAFAYVDAYNYGYLDAVRQIRNISTDDPAWIKC